MKKIVFFLICILTSLAEGNAQQQYYNMWTGNGYEGQSEWIANSKMWLDKIGMEFDVANQRRSVVFKEGPWIVLDKALNDPANKTRMENFLLRSEYNPFNAQFVVDANLSAKRLVVADLATSHDNVQFYNSGEEAFIESNGDENGLHIRSVTGQRIHLHDQVSIGRSNYERANAAGASLTVSGGVFIGPKNMVGSYDITSKTDKFLLWVQKGIVSENFALAKVADWSDHVFNKDYALRPLSEVESFVRTHRHLPDVPSEKEVTEQGYNLHDMNKIFMQKIEELTLYVIEQQKEIDRLKERLENQ